MPSRPTPPKSLASLIPLPQLLVFDFDGTLAPLTNHPRDTVLPTQTAQLLANISPFCTIALLTGRSIADLREKLAHTVFAPDFCIGNHGMEGLPSCERASAQAVKTMSQWRSALEEGTWKTPGIFFEDKTLSASIHFRECQDQESGQQEILRRIESLHPRPEVIEGKLVYNLLPPNSPNKGSALIELIALTQVRSALFMGDDVTDEHGFAVQTHAFLEQSGIDLTTVRIGTQCPTLAEFTLVEQGEVNLFLDALHERLFLSKGEFDHFRDGLRLPLNS